MRSISPIFFFFKVPFLIFLLTIINAVPAVYSLQCLQDEQSSLLQLKQSLVFNSVLSSKLVTWRNLSSNCCNWDGVTCSVDGHVTDLDLSNQSISGGIHKTMSPLFYLQHLQRLDLSRNNFSGTQIPPGVGKLVNLLHLNLAYSHFEGQVPLEISNLTRLLTLDLSAEYHSSRIPSLILENPRLSTLVQNLTKLSQLKLDGVDISSEAQWCHALSSSLPNLQVLSLSRCSLSGPLHNSLVKIQALSVIDLSYNKLSTEVPDFLAELSELTSLKLKDCGLYGYFPRKLFHVATLRTLVLSYNNLLSGTLTDSLVNMKALNHLDLRGCRFNGSIHSIYWEKLHNLVHLDLSHNVLTGDIPLPLIFLPSLKRLILSKNKISGKIGEFPFVSSSSALKILDLRHNKLEGTLPMSLFKLEGLLKLDVSYNKFSGTIDLIYLFQNLSNLLYVDLSFNSLSIIQSASYTPTKHSSFPRRVYLASCNLKTFPFFLRNQFLLETLDLSCNQIQGQIPNWIWKPSLSHLNLSHNSLMGFEGSFPNLTSLTSLWYLDLSSNQLQGHVPLPPSATYMDYSMNNFSSMIPPEIGRYGTHIGFFSLASNNFQGSIPPAICNITHGHGYVLDLSNNSFNGIIPSCLIAKTGHAKYGVLNLRRNKFTGNIPDLFPRRCSLQTIDLSGNQLSGKVPNSMVNCKLLEVLNLGNNELTDGFPCWLREISSLRVLVLKFNKFYGSIECALNQSNVTGSTWPKLQIIDIAANSFSGELPKESFKTWEAMMVDEDSARLASTDLRYEFGGGSDKYYQDTVTITSKGLAMELIKILTIFNAIDFSCNHFQGSIPESIGDLKSLVSLNLSHNHFISGQIPPSLGNLRELESLDLSNNSLSGDIPVELSSLNFLSVLNLSFNQLVGRIPTSTQLQSFSELSYAGNKALCGPPLEMNCIGLIAPLDRSSANGGMGIDWQLIWAEIGYAVGLGSVIGSLVLWERWRLWYFTWVDQLIFRIFPGLDSGLTATHGKKKKKSR